MSSPAADDSLQRHHVRQGASQEDGLLAFLEPPSGEEVRSELDGMSYVQLDSPLEDEVRAQVVDLCIQGASVLASGREVLALDVGSVVTLRVAHPREEWEIRVDCVVRSKRGTAMVRLGLEFRGDGLEGRLVDGAGRWFNRRRGTRVDLIGMRVEGRLTIDGATFPVRINDLSVYGASVRLPSRWCEALRGQEQGRLCLLLPSEGAPVDLGVAVVHKIHDADEEQALVGVRFVGEGASEAADRKRIERFVEGYLAQRLRWAA